MMETRSRRRYDRIASLDALRAERERLDWMIELREVELVQRWGRFREMFSIGYVTGIVSQRLEYVQSLMRIATLGFRRAFSLFRSAKGETKQEKHIPET